MMQTNKYNDYPVTKPPISDYYLISVKPALILKLGLSSSPPIIIGKYDHKKKEWLTVLGSTSLGVGDISSDVTSWCNLPKP